MGQKTLLSRRKRHPSLKDRTPRNLPATSEIHPGIYRITLPLPGKKPGPVNTYLFTGDPVTIVDTGTSKTAPMLRAEINRLGMDFSDIRNIVLTHGHIDHYGAASIIKNESGATVFASPLDRRSVETGYDVSAFTFVKYLRLSAVPVKFWFLLSLMMFVFRRMARTCAVDMELRQGDTVRLGSHEAVVVETPGHTRGSLCFFVKKEGMLFAGDHILPHITPNAFVMLEDGVAMPARKSQIEYYESLEKAESLHPNIVYPAHGRAIDDLGRIASMYRKSFKKRQEQILKIVGSGKDDVYSIARRLFPIVDRRMLVLEIFLMVSEVFTHLQVLEEEGRVLLLKRSGRIVVSLA